MHGAFSTYTDAFLLSGSFAGLEEAMRDAFGSIEVIAWPVLSQMMRTACVGACSLM